MSKGSKIAIVVALLVVVGIVVAMKQGGPGCPCAPQVATQPASGPAATQQATIDVEPDPKRLPRLIEFGAGTCLMCKKMAPIIEAMKHDYAGVLIVEKVDVVEDREQTKTFSIRIIPAQVFLGPDGKELFRHEGFFPREDILAKWKELGYDLAAPAAQ